jgi:cytochrome c-type biogenesis protein CcmH/NrfF
MTVSLLFGYRYFDVGYGSRILTQYPSNRRMVVCWMWVVLPAVVVVAVVPNRGYAWRVPTSDVAATAHRASRNNRRQLGTFVGLAQFQSRSRSMRSDHHHCHHRHRYPNLVALTPCRGQRRSNDNEMDNTPSHLTTRSDSSDDPWLAAALVGLIRPLPGGALNLAPIFPLTLVLLTALVPLQQSLCTALLFALLRTAASQLIPFAEFETNTVDDYDYEPNEIWNDETILQLQIDAFTFILSFVSAALLVPAYLDFDTTDVFWTGPTVIVLMAVVAVIGWMQVQNVVQQVVAEEQLSDADKQLNTWDRKFQQTRSDRDDNAPS